MRDVEQLHTANSGDHVRSSTCRQISVHGVEQPYGVSRTKYTHVFKVASRAEAVHTARTGFWAFHA